ncbi:MAG: hypothetical protein JW885_07145 [Deltaproteobacteria bacterium]|nr:hypothetical protein [Candidatus Zymogenaceae bacterium]
MRVKNYVLIIGVVAVLVCTPLIGLAGDSIHLEEPNSFNNPKDAFGTPPSEWNKTDTQTYGIPPSEWYSTWRDNPALVDLQSNYAFIASMFYMGSFNEFETDMYQAFTGGVGGSYAETTEEYAGNSAGTDLGFLMKFNDISTFGAILHYRYDGILGYGDITTILSNGAGVYIAMTSESVRRSDANSTGLTLLYDIDYSDAFSLGFDLTYMYTNENTNYDVNSVDIVSTGAVVDEEMKIDRETIFNINRISPTIGTSFTPTDSFILNVSFTTDFLFGGVEKHSRLYDWNTAVAVPPINYREHLDDGNLSGYGFSGEADTEIFLTDALSLTYLANASYTDTSWEVDGAVDGYFLPFYYYGLLCGPGTMDYESEERTLNATAGAGMNYDLSGAILHSLITYTYWNRDTAFYQENTFNFAAVVPVSNFTQRTEEELNIMNLKLGATFDVSPVLSMDFGVGYSVGWGRYNLYESIYSPGSTTEIITAAKDTDTFHDMTVGSSMVFRPIDNLNITLSAMGKFPLNQKKYNLSGTTDGATAGGLPISIWSGNTIRDYGSSTWNYGGTLSIGYEF